jgi:hypothetical protein
MAEPVPMSRQEVEARLARAGIRLSDAQLDELHRASGHIAELIGRLTREHPKAAEPALAFSRLPR